MNIDDLRQSREALEYTITYSPNDTAPDKAFDIAEVAALTAQHRYDDLAPVFALLDSYDELAERVKKLETIVATHQERNALVKPLTHDHLQQHIEVADEIKDLYDKVAGLEEQLAQFLVLDEDGKVCHVELVRLEVIPNTHTTATGDTKVPEHTCEGCGLPEDGLKVRNVTIRQNGLCLCTDCAYIETPF